MHSSKTCFHCLVDKCRVNRYLFTNDLKSVGMPRDQLDLSAPLTQSSLAKWFVIGKRNAKYFGSQAMVVLSHTSPIVQFTAILLIAIYLLQLSSLVGEETIRSTLCLKPAWVFTVYCTLKFHLIKYFLTFNFTRLFRSLLSPGQWYWSSISLITYPFVEYHWWQIVVDLLTISLCGTLIEPLWGQKEVVSINFINIF